MKKFLIVALASLLLGLTACGGGASGEKSAPFDPQADAQALLEGGCFSEELTQVPVEIACASYGIDPADVTDWACYGSTGATAEELAILVLKDEAAAQSALKQLGYRVEDRTEDMKSYLPGEVPKLEKAVTAIRGNSVLLVVADSYDGVNRLLER